MKLPPKGKRQTGRGIVVRDNKVLLMERWRGELHYFSIPGGGIELGETAEEAAVRELYEEMDVVVTVERLYLTVLTPDSEHYIFACKLVSGEPHLRPDSPEALEQIKGDNLFKPVWIPFEDISELSFEYWEPLRGWLVEEASKGFTGTHKTVTF